ncbi:MAG: YceI family protein [bacterium]|nr:YceI family protein [bacterium]
MNKFIIALLATISLTLSSFKNEVQSAEWTPVSSSVTFKIKNAGFNVDGKFGAVTAKVVFDGTKSTSNTIEATIDSKTINTGNGMRDGHLKKDEYFSSEKFPKIQMQSTSFSVESNGTFKGFFNLSIKGKTKNIVVPFSFVQKDNNGVFKGTFKINRLDFGVGESSMFLSDEVTLTLLLNVVKK